MFDRSIKGQFQQVSTRDKKAAEYYTSEKFFEKIKELINERIVASGESTIDVTSEIVPQQQDLPHLQKTFDRLKKEFPELNHVRVNTSSFGNSMIFDTKPNSLLRRVAHKWALDS
jgi:hypothetical protein